LTPLPEDNETPNQTNSQLNQQFNQPENDTPSRGTRGLVQSVFAGLFGIQSDKNRQADFKQGRLSDFIFAGIIGTLALLTGMFFIVQQVIATS